MHRTTASVTARASTSRSNPTTTAPKMATSNPVRLQVPFQVVTALVNSNDLSSSVEEAANTSVAHDGVSGRVGGAKPNPGVVGGGGKFRKGFDILEEDRRKLNEDKFGRIVSAFFNPPNY